MSEPFFPKRFEEHAAALLVEDLGDADDDDVVRVACLLDELIGHMEDIVAGEYSGAGLDLPPDVDAEGALWLLRDMRRRELTAGELRAKIRRSLGELARSDT